MTIAPDLAKPSPILGSTEPRLWTPPLRELTPATSYGFEVIDFARDDLGHPLLPWQEVAVVRAGELLPDGRPRFRIVLLLVSRQNGKTELPVVLSVYWQFRKKFPLILGTSTQLSYAKESWSKAINLVKRTPGLSKDHAPGARWYRRANGEVESWTHHGARYKIAASNEEGGRSLTINRGIADELRQHRDYSAWGALEPACSPMDAQIWCLSNMGDDRSVVLNDLRKSALDFIETGEGDDRLGLFEWSAPDGAEPDDPVALAQANPRVGYGLDLDVLVKTGRRVKKLGGSALTTFQTEQMCMQVRLLNPAVDPAHWQACLDPGVLEAGRVAACLDLSPDGAHATLAAAGKTADGRTRVETVAAWTDMRRLRAELPALLEKMKTRSFGWFPGGPAAALAADLTDRRKSGVRGWPPRGVLVSEIRGEVAAVCMGFELEVRNRAVAHSGQALLDDHVGGSEWAPRGEGKVFDRKAGHCDAIYAAAGAVHLARTLSTRREVSRGAH